MSSIAIITARGGSKRIPKKNIRNFCGKPIIAYSIEAAIKAAIFDEVMVSTDSEEIANIAKQYGAKVPFLRSERNADDHATTDDVLLEVLEKYKELGRFFSGLCCLYPTAPFITPEKIRKAYRIFVNNNAAKVICVVPFSFPPQRALIKENETERIKYIFPEKYECRSQDLERWYHDAGQFYFYRVNDYIANRGKIINDIYPIVLSETEVQDIDNEDDWIIAEMKYKLMIANLTDKGY